MNTETFHDDIIYVQTLTPPNFTPSGKVVDRREAWEKGEWIGAFNLWIVKRNPVPSVIYQLRSPNIGWAPNKLDVAVAGHYEGLEGIEGGLREVKEEINKNYELCNMTKLGRKLNVGVGQDDTVRNTVNDIFLIEDEAPLRSYILQKKEIYAICEIPVDELVKVHSTPDYVCKVSGLKNDGSAIDISVNSDIFPPNWDNYHFKMALLISRYFQGDKNLIY